MDALKKPLSLVLSIVLLLGLGFWGGSYWQKDKDYKYFASIPPKQVHTRDTLYIYMEPEVETNVPATIEYPPDTTGKIDSLHFVAKGDTVTFADSAKIAPTYYYPENHFDLVYIPLPQKIIRDSVYVEKIVTVPVEGPVSFLRVVEYVGVGVAAGIIVDKVFLDGNR